MFWKSNSVNYAYRFYMSLILHVRNVRIICFNTRVITGNLSLEYYDRCNMSAKLIRNCIPFNNYNQFDLGNNVARARKYLFWPMWYVGK